MKLTDQVSRHEIDGHENDGHEIGGQDIYRLSSVQFFTEQRQNTSHSVRLSSDLGNDERHSDRRYRVE